MKVLFSCEDRGGESIPYGEYSTTAAPTKGRTFLGPSNKLHRGLLAYDVNEMRAWKIYFIMNWNAVSDVFVP